MPPDGNSSILNLPMEKGRLYWQTRALWVCGAFFCAARIFSVSSVVMICGTFTFIWISAEDTKDSCPFTFESNHKIELDK